MSQTKKRFHNTFLLLLMAALIPAGAVFVTDSAEAAASGPNIPYPCDITNYESTINIKDGCCLRGDYLRWHYVEYKCTFGKGSLEWQPISDWCGWSLCAGVEPPG